MNQAVKSKSRMKRLVFRTLPVLALLAALLVALLLVSGAQNEPAGPGGSTLDNSFIWVLTITAAALAILLWSIGYRLISLVRNVRSGVPGALLAARWVRNFIALSLPPALIVFFFSAWFLTSTIDSWFDVRVEAALADSLELGQEFLDTRTLEVRNQLRDISGDLALMQEDGELLRQALAVPCPRRRPGGVVGDGNRRDTGRHRKYQYADRLARKTWRFRHNAGQPAR